MSVTYHDSKVNRERTLYNLSLAYNDKSNRFYVIGIDNQTGRYNSRFISREEAQKLFNLSRPELNKYLDKAINSTSGSNNPHVPPMNDVETPNIPDPYYPEQPSPVKATKPTARVMSGKGARFKPIPKSPPPPPRRLPMEGGQIEIDKMTEALQQAKISPKPKQHKEEYRTGVYRGPTAKERKSRKSQNGGLSPALISGIADGLGKAAEGMHGTLQKGLDNIGKQRQREFEKNQMTGWYDRKGARNDRRQGARNMKQIANNMDYIRQEYIKERGIPLSNAEVFQMALEFSKGG